MFSLQCVSSDAGRMYGMSSLIGYSVSDTGCMQSEGYDFDSRSFYSRR